jgi:hypothetical protein
MALTITGVADCRASLGPSQELRAYQLQPAANDYPTGGYIINATQIALSWLYGGVQIAVNAAGALYLAQFVLPSGSFGTIPAPATSGNLIVSYSTSGGGAFTQVPNATDLSGVTWIFDFLGY